MMSSSLHFIGQIFMDYFSSALRYEYSDKGIIVQVESCELYIIVEMNSFYIQCKILAGEDDSYNILVQLNRVCR